MQKSSLLLLWISIIIAETGIDIIERVDKNLVANTISYTAKLRISVAGQIREKELIGYVQGKDKAYLEFTAPARDRGTRFLKIGDEMWIYVKDIEKATKIAGHMLRQSFAGSDFSYDDVTSNEKLKEQYQIELIGTDTIFNRECYQLLLVARTEAVTYYKRVLWIDKEYYYPMKEELFAKSGKLMKSIVVSEFKKIRSKNYPCKIRMENKLRQNTYTELILENIKLDEPIPTRIFTRSYLERK
ncbi:MAG: outer membrane lipoprotein-sorting protein [candidate division WOR-3 bacterium]